MNRTLAVARYQALLDLKAVKTYVLLAIVVFLSLSYDYLLPKFASGYFFVYVRTTSAWMYTTSEIFTTIITGLMALFVGGMLGTDVMAEEFENGTISKLFSLPLHRSEIYLGKLLEKFLLSLLYGLLFITISIACAYILSGQQGYFVWSPVFLLGLTLLLIGFASLGFLLGTFIRQTSFVFGILFGIWVLFTVVYGIVTLKGGTLYETFAIPFVNMSLIPAAIHVYIIDPNKVLHFSYTALNSTTKLNVQAWKFAALIISSASIEVFFILLAGFIKFRKMELKG
jgi:ABC-2 type transport system permease protein